MSEPRYTADEAVGNIPHEVCLSWALVLKEALDKALLNSKRGWQTATEQAERGDRLRAENARLAAALARIAGQSEVVQLWTEGGGTLPGCDQCEAYWPRELRPNDDGGWNECPYCIARAARPAAVGVGERLDAERE